MRINYATELEGDPKLQERLRRFTAELESVMGPESASLATAEWQSLADQKGRTLYRLTLSDPFGRGSADFSPDEINAPLYMRLRLYKLWGELLRVQSDKQHEKVNRLFRELVTDRE